MSELYFKAPEPIKITIQKRVYSCSVLEKKSIVKIHGLNEGDLSFFKNFYTPGKRFPVKRKFDSRFENNEIIGNFKGMFVEDIKIGLDENSVTLSYDGISISKKKFRPFECELSELKEYIEEDLLLEDLNDKKMNMAKILSRLCTEIEGLKKKKK